jgi:hypothetical protein
VSIDGNGVILDGNSNQFRGFLVTGVAKTGSGTPPAARFSWGLPPQ